MIEYKPLVGEKLTKLSDVLPLDIPISLMIDHQIYVTLDVVFVQQRKISSWRV